MNNSEEGFETIIRNTEEPETVTEDRNEHIKTKEAKLTGRTKDSLKKKRKDRTLLKSAFAKYNKYYSKMHDSASRVVKLQRAQESGKDISDKRIQKKAAEVSSYSKKLAKWAVRVLDDDIKEIAMAKAAKARRVRTPMKLVENLRRFSWTRILRAREEAKIKHDTKEFIKQSVSNAFYKDEYSDDVNRDEKTQGQLMRDLALGKDDKLSTLRGFIVKNDEKGNPVHLTEPVHRSGNSNKSTAVDEEEKSKTQNPENDKKDSEDALVAALARKKLEAERSAESTEKSNPIFEAIAKSKKEQLSKGGDHEKNDENDSLNNDVSIKEAQEALEELNKYSFSDNPSLQEKVNDLKKSIEEYISNEDTKTEVVNVTPEALKTATPLASEQVTEKSNNESLDKSADEKGSNIHFGHSPDRAYSEPEVKTSAALVTPEAMDNLTRRGEEAKHRLENWSAREGAAQKRLADANEQLQSENEAHKKLISYAEALKAVVADEEAAFQKENQVRAMVTKAEQLEQQRVNVSAQSQDLYNEVKAIEEGRKR